MVQDSSSWYIPLCRTLLSLPLFQIPIDSCSGWLFYPAICAKMFFVAQPQLLIYLMDEYVLCLHLPVMYSPPFLVCWRCSYCSTDAINAAPCWCCAVSISPLWDAPHWQLLSPATCVPFSFRRCFSAFCFTPHCQRKRQHWPIFTLTTSHRLFDDHC